MIRWRERPNGASSRFHRVYLNVPGPSGADCFVESRRGDHILLQRLSAYELLFDWYDYMESSRLGYLDHPAWMIEQGKSLAQTEDDLTNRYG